MIGFEVAPVAPMARLAVTSRGSTESNQSFVPAAINDCKGVSCAMALLPENGVKQKSEVRMQNAELKNGRVFPSAF
jgi:hypothetical protein